MLGFYFWDSRHLFVSDSWYCQMQTTRLIMFFRKNNIFIFSPRAGVRSVQPAPGGTDQVPGT